MVDTGQRWTGRGQGRKRRKGTKGKEKRDTGKDPREVWTKEEEKEFLSRFVVGGCIGWLMSCHRAV